MKNRLLRHRKTLIFAFLAAALCLFMTLIASVEAVGNFFTWISAPSTETAIQQTMESVYLTNTGVVIYGPVQEPGASWTPTKETPR
jgi:hypothetical protein